MNLYTEKSTRLIYDVANFGDTILVRPISPGFESAVMRLDIFRFAEEFEEYSGNYDQIRECIGRAQPVELIDPGNVEDYEPEEESA